MYEWWTKILDLERVPKVIEKKFDYNHGDAEKAGKWNSVMGILNILKYFKMMKWVENLESPT